MAKDLAFQQILQAEPELRLGGGELGVCLQLTLQHLKSGAGFLWGRGQKLAQVILFLGVCGLTAPTRTWSY